MHLLVDLDAVLRDVVERPPTALHIVRAERSDRWPSREWQRLQDIMRAQVMPPCLDDGSLHTSYGRGEFDRWPSRKLQRLGESVVTQRHPDT